MAQIEFNDPFAPDDSDDEADDLGFMHYEIKEEWKCVEHEKLKLSLLENMDTRLQLVRSLKSGELGMEYILIYREDFQQKIDGSTEMAEKLQRRYDRIPKVFVMSGQEQIDIFVRIDQGVSGRFIKEKARPYVESKFCLCFMSGRVLADEEEVKGSSHVIFTCVPKPS